jgi:hypothetical protein
MCFDGRHRSCRIERTAAERSRSALGRVHMSMRTSEGGNNAEVVRVWLLSGFQVCVGRSTTREDDAWRLRKAKAIVKLQALAPGHRLHRARVLDLLWQLPLRRAWVRGPAPRTSGGPQQWSHHPRLAIPPYPPGSSWQAAWCQQDHFIRRAAGDSRGGVALHTARP